MARTDQR